MGARILSDDQFADQTNTFSYGYAGGTRNVHTGEEHPIGSPGFVVAHPGHELTVPGPATGSDVRAHRLAMLRDSAVRADPAATQGSWHVKPGEAAPAPNGEEVTYDRGRVHQYAPGVPSGPASRSATRARAISEGRRGAQRAIFDLNKGEDITLPGGVMHDHFNDLLKSTRVRAGLGWIGR